MQPHDPQRAQGPAAGGLALSICLVAVAGYVDAVGFLRFGELFVSFMSGNSVQLAVLPMLGRVGQGLLSGGLVLLFVMGVFAGRLVEGAAGAWAGPALLSLAAILLAIGAGAGFAGEVAGQGAALLGISLSGLTLAMGLLNAVPKPPQGPEISVTYVTGVLVRLGRALADTVSGRTDAPWAVYLLNWLALLLGAALGALAAARFALAALFVPAAAAALLALVCGGLVRRAQPPRSPR